MHYFEVNTREQWFRLFDSIRYVPSTIFQLCSEWSSRVEPVLGLMCLAQWHNAVTPAQLKLKSRTQQILGLRFYIQLAIILSRQISNILRLGFYRSVKTDSILKWTSQSPLQKDKNIELELLLNNITSWNFKYSILKWHLENRLNLQKRARNHFLLDLFVLMYWTKLIRSLESSFFEGSNVHPISKRLKLL